LQTQLLVDLLRNAGVVEADRNRRACSKADIMIWPARRTCDWGPGRTFRRRVSCRPPAHRTSSVLSRIAIRNQGFSGMAAG